MLNRDSENKLYARCIVCWTGTLTTNFMVAVLDVEPGLCKSTLHSLYCMLNGTLQINVTLAILYAEPRHWKSTLHSCIECWTRSLKINVTLAVLYVEPGVWKSTLRSLYCMLNRDTENQRNARCIVCWTGTLKINVMLAVMYTNLPVLAHASSFSSDPSAQSRYLSQTNSLAICTDDFAHSKPLRSNNVGSTPTFGIKRE